MNISICCIIVLILLILWLLPIDNMVGSRNGYYFAEPQVVTRKAYHAGQWGRENYSQPLKNVAFVTVPRGADSPFNRNPYYANVYPFIKPSYAK